MSDEQDWRNNVNWPLHETYWARFIEYIAYAVVWPMLKVSVTGAENMPANGGCIVVPNHISNFDPIVLSLHLPRHAFFMTKIELFDVPIAGWHTRQTGSFPVKRGEQDTWALEHAGKVLNAGETLCMFPEGTRSKESHPKLKKGKMGTVKLALEFKVPVIPIAIWGTHNANWKKYRTRVDVRIGQPLDLVAMAGPPPYDLHLLRDLTTTLMQHIATMLPEEGRGIYSSTAVNNKL